MNFRALAAGMLSSALLTACSGTSLRERPQPGPTPTQANARMSCLAMSGGGIRSGAVSLGALQTLHATGALKRYPLLSTVSGGGYPVYGLLYRMIANGVELADLLDNESRYFTDVERNSSFISGTPLATEVFLQGPLGVPLSLIGRTHASLQPYYIAAIHQTFVGESRPIFGQPLLIRAKRIRQMQQFPVPIFGTSYKKGATPPRPDHEYHYRDFFELSPFDSGAPAIGYFPRFARQVGLAQAVAMSAAGIDTPKKDMSAPWFVKAMNFGLGSSFNAPTASGDKQVFYLSDGGFIENLALLPLLRHGCTDILAFDNSGDTEPDKTFDTWQQFEKHIGEGEEPGWRITQPLALAGTRDGVDKARTPWTLAGHIWDAELANGERRVHIRLVKLGIDRDKLSRYPAPVREFAKQNWLGRKFECTGAGLGSTCPFPQESTARQEFLPEEFRAYRYLGQWLTAQALCAPPPDWESTHENLADRVDCGAGTAAVRVLEPPAEG